MLREDVVEERGRTAEVSASVEPPWLPPCTNVRVELGPQVLQRWRASGRTHLGHAVVAKEDEQASLPVGLVSVLEVSVDALDDLVHLDLLWRHQRAVAHRVSDEQDDALEEAV